MLLDGEDIAKVEKLAMQVRSILGVGDEINAHVLDLWMAGYRDPRAIAWNVRARLVPNTQ
jgi:hypothetical protein